MVPNSDPGCIEGGSERTPVIKTDTTRGPPRDGPMNIRVARNNPAFILVATDGNPALTSSEPKHPGP